MNRRELLKLITATTGTAMIGGAAVTLLSGCALQPQAPLVFSAEKIVLLDEIAETILPRTDTPGAKDAKVGEFMAIYVTDCYTPLEQTVFHQGLIDFEESCNTAYGRSFMNLSPAEREAFVSQLDQQAYAQATQGNIQYFTMIKQLTLFGFFTSKEGGTQVLRHAPIPGRFDGELAYKPGDRAWATK